MKIAILGTGPVAKTLGGKLATIGHDVTLGTRDPAATMARSEADMFGLPPIAQWRKEHAAVGLETFADAAEWAEIVINASAGAAGTASLEAAGSKNLGGKILIDLSNPLDFSQGMPPMLSVCNDDSLGERIQRAFPDAKVVKTLNTVNAFLMIDPGQLNNADHTMFVAGNDEDAKAAVTGFLKDWFGWKDVLDLGDITNARGTEMMLPVWTRIYSAIQNPNFAFKIVR
jgi:8-hydroxy-5-deazaflavin:NADPH oxidoreductase